MLQTDLFFLETVKTSFGHINLDFCLKPEPENCN